MPAASSVEASSLLEWGGGSHRDRSVWSEAGRECAHRRGGTSDIWISLRTLRTGEAGGRESES